MADRRRKRSVIAVALTLGVSVIVPLAVTTLGAVGAALFVAAKYTTATPASGPATRTRGEGAETAVEQGVISSTID